MSARTPVILGLGKHNRSLKVAVQGLDFMAHPLIHTYILGFIVDFLSSSLKMAEK
jgi:hypothetical protein